MRIQIHMDKNKEGGLRKKVLVVEDESALQKVVDEVLTDEGYEVYAALDGASGLEKAKSVLPDLVLLDLILPEKDGFYVLKELKADKQTQNIPVIVLTNLESASDVEKVLEMGATTYLVKTNYTLEDIVKKVNDTLR